MKFVFIELGFNDRFYNLKRVKIEGVFKGFVISFSQVLLVKSQCTKLCYALDR